MTQPLSCEVEIEDLVLYTVSGIIYDIRSEFLDLFITESIDSEFMRGYLSVNDLSGISEFRDGYSGGMLKIKFRTNKEFPFIDKLFWIYKVGDDNEMEQLNQVNRREIKFFFASLSMQLELYEKYSLYYNNLYPHEIVSKVCSDLLEIPALNKVDTTDKKISIVVPYSWSPLNIIDHCIKYSVSVSNKDAGYLFFENNLGYNFVSISELLKQNFKYELTLAPPEDDRDKYKGYINHIISYKTIKHIDLIESWMSKRFGSSIHYIDFDDIRFKEIKHDLKSYLPKTMNLGTRTTTTSVNNNERTSHFPFYGGNKEVKLMNYSRYNLMQDNIILATLPGDSRKLAGDIVKIRFPSKEKTLDVNESLNGNWVVFSITHVISNRLQYHQQIKLVKDALAVTNAPNLPTVKNNP